MTAHSPSPDDAGQDGKDDSELVEMVLNCDWSEIVARGFDVHAHSANHVQLVRPAICVDFWPDANKFMAHGWVRLGGVHDIRMAIDNSQLKMPPNARQGQCKFCGAPIWWVQSSKGNRMPLDGDGAAHVGRCPGVAR
jgi:hypothetical protein